MIFVSNVFFFLRSTWFDCGVASYVACYSTNCGDLGAPIVGHATVVLVPPSPPLDVLTFVESFLFRPELFLLAAWVRFFHLVPLHWYSHPSYRDTIFGISILFMLPLIWLWSQQYSRGDFAIFGGDVRRVA